MGADIHLVVEASDTEQFVAPQAIAFFEWPRRSSLFNAMNNRHGRDDLVAARGFPEPASAMANFHYGLNVIDDDDMDGALAMPSIARSEADEALRTGESHPIAYRWDFISAPHYSRCSWLTLAEFRRAVAATDDGELHMTLECRLTIDLMANIEARGYFCRMVFWFDL
ncbi:hypothetical protein [Massilia rubra]|uniref:Uncharacterized protein n=1 Tax=Massilia rubra TaxID=2607910 RepID=A0ABX0LGJ3_9BURK|nr:hypothetical protein [Massilia rubra]NHZ33956.1 hypothetical protein [Massilia rubra]